MWLASTDMIDLQAANTVKLVREQITYPMNGLNPILDNSLFDYEFFDILEKAYKLHLRKAMITFGQTEDMEDVDMDALIAPKDDDDEEEEQEGNKGQGTKGKGKERDDDSDKEDNVPDTAELLWRKAFPIYIASLCQELKEWVKKKIDVAENLTLRLVLDRLVPKIEFLHRNGMLADHEMLPVVNSPVPVLAVLFYTDLATSLARVSDGIAIVSL